MSNNTKIFSEAIAEAKAIRETAMANAKLALEEAFAPRIQEMMSDKLEAMSYEEDEKMEEDYKEMEEGNMKDMEEISLEELLAELEDLKEGDKEMEESYKKEMEEGNMKDMEEGMYETKPKMLEAEDDDEVGTISVEELKDIIRDIMIDVMGGEEEEEEEEMSTEDDLELEEILAEIASLEEGDDEIEEGLKDTVKKVGDKISKGFDKFYDAGTKVVGKIAEPGSATKAISREGKEVEEAVGGSGESSMNNPAIIAINNLADKVAKATGKTVDMVKAKLMDLMKEELEETTELQEAMSTITTLRSELNEVNLLNAKLLYVNKLFKAKNLNEAQKVKVINAFDRAETVREAKNVFDTLNESLNTEKAKSQIKESLSFASKSAGVSDRQPIIESNDFVNRMQKLAGII